MGLKTRRRSRPIREALTGVKDAIARGTSVWENGPVRIDWKKLDDEQATELVRLTDKAATGMGFNLDKLSKGEREAWERVVEVGGNLGAGWFARTRKAERTRAEIQRLTREAQRPVQPQVRDQERILRLLHAHVRDGVLHLDRVALFVHVLGQLLASEPLGPRSTIEGAGDTATLVLDRRYGFGYAHDPHGQLARWEEALKQLARVGYLETQQSGQTLRVRLGPLALRALGRRVPKNGKAA